MQAFRRAIGQQLAGRPLRGVLVLTEPQTRPSFADLQRDLRGKAATKGAWTLTGTEEDISLRATHPSGDTLFLLSGQQIITRENLEVLSLLAPATATDGLSLPETVAEVLRIGGLPVLPWGVGKWLGKRGAIVSNFLRATTVRPLFLGDNGGRPAFWRSIPQFDQAREAGIAILRGSDPLRCSYSRRGAGSFGNLPTCPFDSDRPGNSVREALTAPAPALQDFGNLEQPWFFCKDQLALRIS